MTTYEPAKKNTAYITYIGLPSQGTPGAFQSNPTLAAGDVKVSIDGGALANVTTLPTVTPASGKMVKLSLSSSEMNGDNITVVFSDAAGAEWSDAIINIPTAARQIDDLAFPATSGRSMVVDAAGLVDANTVKVGPTGAGTAQTAGDVYGLEVTIASYIDTEVASIKTQTDKMVFTVANQLDVNVIDWKGATAPAMTGDAYARLGAPAGASVSADILSIKNDTLRTVTRAGTLQAGAAGTVTLDAGASAVDDYYVGQTVVLIGGTGGGQSRTIKSYVGATKVATVTSNWATTPDNTTGYATMSQSGQVDVRTVTGTAQTARDLGGTLGAAGAGLTALGDTRIANLDATVSSRLAAGSYTAPPSANANADALLDRTDGIETGWTFRQIMRLFAAVLTGKVSGAGTGTETFRDVGDTKNRVVATVDGNGNRTAITKDVS